MTRTPMPHELWAQAKEIHPADSKARAELYMRLLEEAGHVIPKEQANG